MVLCLFVCFFVFGFFVVLFCFLGGDGVHSKLAQIVGDYRHHDLDPAATKCYEPSDRTA